MKKQIPFIAIALLIMSFSTSEPPLTKAEKDYAIIDMRASYKRVLQSVKGLSETQLHFKADPNSWSIAECVEHIALSESNIFGMVESSLQSAPDPSQREKVTLKDDAFRPMITDRSHKVKTSKPFEPSGKFGDFKATLKAFKSKRKANIKFVKNTQEDLRNRYADLPFGTIDAYQVFLFMSAHTERHVLQIEEVKAHKNFPKQ